MADSQTDLLDAVVQPEIKEFLVTAIEMMPKMTNIMKVTSKMYDLAEALSHDRGIVDTLKSDPDLIPDPIQDTIEEGIILVHEAQERAQSDTSKVGMIGLYRMLKDPTIQNNLKFMKALLAVIAEHQKRASYSNVPQKEIN